jgi:AMP-polyphosphate phosphotransferase
MPRRFNSAAIWRADGKCASSVEIGFMRSASSSACLLLASQPGVQPPSVLPRALAALRPWKLSYEDFRNRSRWVEYEVATEDMMRKTSPKWAPWYLIPANDKLYGRLAAFTILIEVLRRGLSLKPRPLDPKVAEMAKQLFDLADER